MSCGATNQIYGNQPCPGVSAPQIAQI